MDGNLFFYSLFEMVSALLLLLLPVAATVQECGMCLPFPALGSGCPFGGKECVEAEIDLRDLTDGMFSGACYDQNAEDPLETWIQTADDKFYYAHNVLCADMNSTAINGVSEYPTIKDGNWKAATRDHKDTGVYVGEDATRVVCAKNTGCPQCVSLPFAAGECCLGDKNCVHFLNFETKSGIFGHKNSVCELYNCAEIHIEMIDGSHEQVDSVQCNTATHDWLATRGETKYERNLWTKVKCIAYEYNRKWEIKCEFLSNEKNENARKKSSVHIIGLQTKEKLYMKGTSGPKLNV